LSYDIIKAHGGEFKVETKEGEGSEFVIQLPVWINWQGIAARGWNPGLQYVHEPTALGFCWIGLLIRM